MNSKERRKLERKDLQRLREEHLAVLAEHVNKVGSGGIRVNAIYDSFTTFSICENNDPKPLGRRARSRLRARQKAAKP